MTTPTTDTSEFDAFEALGWERQATGYDGFFGRITARLAAPLLDATGVGPGTRLLDLATGTGVVAGAAVARGARVTGLDVAEAMLAIARRRWSTATFRRGDAHELPFANGTFDALTASFAVLHLGRPDVALREAARVLTPGGRMAVTVWDDPAGTAVFESLRRALDRCGAEPPADVPEGPDFFRFADEETLTALLTNAGLVDVTVVTHRFTHPASGVEEVWRGVLDGTVRTSALVTAQPADTVQHVRAAFAADLERHRQGDQLQLPVSVKLASGSRPRTRL